MAHGSNHAQVCLYTAYELRMIFIFLKGCKREKKRKRRIYDRDHRWPAKPKMFTMWLLQKRFEKVGLVK